MSVNQAKFVNVLCQYKGGGYDGCFWEYNYFTFDNNGDFHDVASSGYAGLPTEEKARVFLGDPENADQFSFYDLTEQSEIDNFCASTARPHVLGVLRFFDENPNKCGNYDFPNGGFYAKCDECGHEISDGILESWHGCGGLASTADELLCEDCYSSGTCRDCGEYYGTDSLDGDGNCEYCAKQNLNNELKRLVEISDNVRFIRYIKSENTFTDDATATDVIEDEDDALDGVLFCLWIDNLSQYFVVRAFREAEAFGAVSDILAQSSQVIARAKVWQGSVSEILDVLL